MEQVPAASSGALSPFQLAALLGVVTLISLFVARIVSSTFPGRKPPIFEGVPFVGGLIKFAGGPWKLMQDGHSKFGDAFTVPVAHKRVTFLIGPDVAPHFFKATDDEMSQTEVYNFNVPTFGKGVVYDVDQKTRTEQFRFFTEALKRDRLAKYVPQFVQEAEAYFSKWGESGVVDLKEEFSKLIALTAARTLLGREIREQLFDEVADLLHDLDDGMRPISVFFPYLPTAYHNKRDAARAKLGKIFAKVIEARRASNIKEEDVLQQFVDARYQNVCNGRQLTPDEITGLSIATLFAGQHTSSITSAWTGHEMINSKKRGPKSPFAAAVAEQQSIIGKFGSDLNMDVLGEMETLHLNIQEALRMHPPLLMVMRYVKQPFSVTTSQGTTYTIPKGDICMVSPNFSHMLPTVFKNPESYEPQRFLSPRDEDKKKPYSYLGFGGGRHACIGQNFAYLQIKSIWSVLLRNFDFEMLDPVPEPDYDSMVIGPKAARVRYVRRKL